MLAAVSNDLQAVLLLNGQTLIPCEDLGIAEHAIEMRR